ncbi:MAG: hypothetical protein NTV17_10860 [Burkholderiales bacterium]|nr:hypothetical protein [Burkholderiales bacterium]
MTAVAASNMTPVPCRVLVVDDNVDAARTMAMLLELEGYQVECAFDGQQALDCARQTHCCSISVCPDSMVWKWPVDCVRSQVKRRASACWWR